MALKRQYDMTSLFSMASMTDIIFLLLIFFMVTSTYVFPTALELNLPQSSEQTAIKPAIRVYIYADGKIFGQAGDDDPQELTAEALETFLKLARQNVAEGQGDNIAVYADEEVTYGALVSILDIGARNNMKMVLATKPAPVATPAEPTE